MVTIAFVDTEIDPNSGKILDIGSIRDDEAAFHSRFVSDFIKFLHGSHYVCGHNIFNHDLKYIRDTINAAGLDDSKCIDTLYLSPLLFPRRPYHALLKDDKLQTEEFNNPLNDSKKARDLFFSEIAAFQHLDDNLKKIFYTLLKDKSEFCCFFRYIGYQNDEENPVRLIREKFHSQICEHSDLRDLVLQYPIELAYSLALINTNDRYSITPPWVLFNFPYIQHVMHRLRSQRCLEGCTYCNEFVDVRKGLKKYFGFDSYRTFGGEPLQEKSARDAMDNKSLLSVFPTGGGKSIAFQVPALMSGANSRGLTVVISPLQSLMKDQVDNLENRGITDAVTINGLLDPIEREEAYNRVEDGDACLLYISPELLRSKTIERLLMKRNVIRFVIDEAHCLSSWGHDFRVDYLYIGDFIQSLQQKKILEEGIPVSCFTATAKPQVIEDIRNYFKDKLKLELDLHVSNESRKNLHFKVHETKREIEKYNTLRDLIKEKNCPTIVYVSRTKIAEDLSERLTRDGYLAKPYHGQMDKDIKTKNQDAFLKGDLQIMVATSAFGMGVDKKDVGLVIHYEIADSLENYIQESGRAGRDETISADCFILFNDEDLNKHFVLLNETKLSIQEIQQIWRAIKEITYFRSKVSQSALEIARKAGWDESIDEIETRVKTAIAALEEAGYVRRGQNSPRIFADSILAKNAQEAIDKINLSAKFAEKKKQNAIRIIKSLISSRSLSRAGKQEAESRIDYLSDRLGIEKADVIDIVNLLRDEKILADNKDLTVFIKKKDSKNHSLNILESYSRIEKYLLSVLEEQEKTFNVKEINEKAEESGCRNVNPDRIRILLNFWAIKGWIKKQTVDWEKNHVALFWLYPKESIKEKVTLRLEIARFIVDYLYEKGIKNESKDLQDKENIPVEFSVLELKDEFEHRSVLFKNLVSFQQVEDALFYLSRIGALSIEGGFLVIYNALTIERIEQDNRKQYKVQDYHKLEQFYKHKIQQIHIIGEYARKMIGDYKAALQFVDDYFKLNYNSFLNKYFKGSQQNEIGRNVTPARFKKLFGELSTRQLAIIQDKQSKYIVVAAGPGSGKTRILVHKLASLLLMEDIKSEQLLMLTFSRAAATEFKKRLIQLIGNAAYYIDIKTFHSYCFDLLGKVGTLEKSGEIVREAVNRIRNGDVEADRVTKSVLVIDEAQDIDSGEFELITTLMGKNEEMRVIAVGDDDQNIFEFRGASSEYLKKLIFIFKATRYELLDNYRSKNNIVEFSNQFVKRIRQRLKNSPIKAIHRENGSIKLVRYINENIITPVVNDILSAELAGTTGVLTRTNEEALQITGLLLKNGMQAKLMQSNEGFDLLDLLEIRFFKSHFDSEKEVPVIEDDIWNDAKQKLKEKFSSSPNLEMCTSLIADFEQINPKIKYKTDLDVFIHESKLEDFYGNSGETIFVSTIHKAKGREFDNVFLVLDRFNVETDEVNRQLYVAMTRAKSRLNIHYSGNYLDNIVTEGIEKVTVKELFQPPPELAMQLTHKDVWLDYFASYQPFVSQLISGDKLIFDGESCRNIKGIPVLKFSKQCLKQIEGMKQKNYLPKTAKIRFIVYWKGENLEKEIKIILPELYFERKIE